MPRFVILAHDHPFLHWDFMLEWGQVLRTWRLPAPPDRSEPIAAEALQDHRLHYLDYEGPVSGDRGSVRRWDWGEFTVIEETATGMAVHLQGRHLQCEAVLHRCDSTSNWTFRRDS